MNESPDDLLVILFLLTCAAVGVFYLVDLWQGSRFADVWRTVRADWRLNREQRKAVREAKRSGSHAEVLTRLRLVMPKGKR